MKDLFVPYELAVKLKEKGFNKPCLAEYSEMEYPVNEMGSKFKNCKCLYLYDSDFDYAKMIWIESDHADFHWSEGNQDGFEHSRCDFGNNEVKAPLWQQVVDWLREEKKIIVKIDQTVGNDFLYVVHSAVNTEDFIRSEKRQEYYSAFQSGIEKALELLNK